MKRIVKLTAFAVAMAYFIICVGSLGVFAIEDEVNQETTETPVETVPIEYTPMFYLPGNMRGVIISPEVDFFTSPDDSKAVVSMQLDSIFAKIEEIGLNAVIIKTSVEDRVYYDLDMNKSEKTDFIKLAVEKAQSLYLGVYLIYDIGYAINSEADSAEATNNLISQAHRFTIKYPCNGVILDNYYSDPESNTYRTYMKNGSGIGYENWLFDSTEYLFETAGAIVRMTDNTVPVGVMINDVWANDSSNPEGSPTNDSVQAYFDGYADTKKYIEQKYVDFITLRCYGSLDDANLPFDQTAQWWGEVCEEQNIPMYLIHYNEKLGKDYAGWGSEDQLLRQLTTAKDGISAYSGSVFNSYQTLAENPLNSTNKITQFYSDLIDEDSLFEELVMYSPKELNFTTNEPVVNFAGTFDQNFDVYLNGSKITLNEAGNFYFEKQLEIGQNTFTLKHKDKTYTYSIYRKIIVMRELNASISDGKTLRVDGGTSITLEAVAYKGATVNATINGQTIKLVEQKNTLQDENISTAYTSFTGKYTVPDGIVEVEQSLGKINVQASYLGQSSTLIGASVYVNAKPKPPEINYNFEMLDQSKLGTGEVVGTIDAIRSESESVQLVKVLNNNTIVYDAKTTGTVFNPQFGQLPKGTLDYLNSTLDGYYTTESGKRFNSDEVSIINGNGFGKNALFVQACGNYGGDSYLKFTLDKKISYNVEAYGVKYYTQSNNDYYTSGFNAEYIYVTFDNVTSVTKLPEFDNNYVFDSGKWEQVTVDGIPKFRLILHLRQKGVYAGNSAYYNSDGDLMLTFPVLTNSLSGMTIVIDPGHGYGKNPEKLDPGAIGHVVEQQVNLAIAKKLATKLTNMGAKVIRLETEKTFILTKTRPVVARGYNCDLFISLHSNMAPGNDSARGTETYYFTPFSQPLAEAVVNSVSNYFTKNVYSDGANKNRGAMYDIWWVTLQQDFPSIMLEMGFVSNYEDAMALANETHQDGIANAIAVGIKNYLSRSSISSSSNGSSGVPSGSALNADNDDENDGDEDDVENNEEGNEDKEDEDEVEVETSEEVVEESLDVIE